MCWRLLSRKRPLRPPSLREGGRGVRSSVQPNPLTPFPKREGEPIHTFTSRSFPCPNHVQDRFQTRDEIVSFIEQQAASAVEKAVQASPQVERRVPWVTSGPVGRDSAGYSVLKAAAFALGYLGPDQAKEELHVHNQLRDLYQTYGFVPHCGHQSFLVPLATNHLPAFEPQGASSCATRFAQKMTVHADRFDPDEADWIGRKLGLRTKALGTISDLAGGSLVPLPDARRTDRLAAQPGSVRRRPARRKSRCRRTAACSFPS